MAAIVIIGLLLGISIPKFLFMVTAAKQAASKGYLASLRSATNIYYSDNVFYPYTFSDLPYTETDGIKYDTVKTKLQKTENPWIPKYLNKWPVVIRIGQGNWVSSSKNHEKGNDMRVVERTPDPLANHEWPEEIIYDRSSGHIYINCNVVDKDGKIAYEW